MARFITRDQNGNPVHQDIRREVDGWHVTVWFGSYPATNIRRYVYETRAQARKADISHTPGRFGCIAIAACY